MFFLDTYNVAEAIGAFDRMVLVLFLLLLLPAIFYLIALKSTLASIHKQNRTMEPAKVWELLIPVFNIFFQFSLVKKVADSIRNELRARTVSQRPTYGIDLT